MSSTKPKQAKMSTEYDLQYAGAFSETDLLDFKQSELEKGNVVEKIWITRLQANHLANSVHGIKPKKTGMKLVDYWNIPATPTELKSIHGIEIGVDEPAN
jgi:hypothetical protein